MPKRRVLVSVAADASLDALHDAIAIRLDVKPTRCCLGESEAAVTTVDDLRDGDVLRVAEPALTLRQELDAPASDLCRLLIKFVLTLVIFVILFEAFQRLIFVPFWRPDLADVGLLPDEEIREF